MDEVKEVITDELEYLSRDRSNEKKDDNVKEVKEIGKEEIKEEVVDDVKEDDEADVNDVKEDNDDDTSESEEETKIDETDSLYQKLKAHDPKLLKLIPELRTVIFAEQEYREAFPTVEEAKEAREIVETFAQYQNDLTSGNVEPLLEALEKTGKDKLEGFVANIIPSIFKMNKDLAVQMLYPEFKKMLRAAMKHGSKDMEISAGNIHYYLFGDHDYKSDVGLKPKELDPKDDELTQREKAFEKKQYDTFSNDIQTVLDKRMSKIIGTSEVMANSGLSVFLQKKITEEVMQEVDKQILLDKRIQGNISALWTKARREGYTTEGKDRLLSAYLSRAKVLMPKVLANVLAQAKTDGKQTNKLDKQPVRLNSGKPNANENTPISRVNVKDIDWSNFTEADFIAGKKPPLLKKA